MTMPKARDDPDNFTLGAAGGDEVVVVPWPVIIRERLARKVISSDRYRWWVLWTVLAGLFSINVTFTVFVVALPRVAQQFHTSEATLTWVVTGPLLSVGIAAPLLGKAGDVWGHRRLYLLGLLGGVLCAALSAAAPDATTLIVARTLEGFEGAATGAASMALILKVFDRGDRVKAMGFWSLVGAGGPVIGVVLGAPLIQAFGWRWLFIGQIPFSLAALVVAAVILPGHVHEARDAARDGDGDASAELAEARAQKLDWAGVGWVTLAVSALLFGLNRGPVMGWSSPVVLVAIGLGPLALIAFVWVERRSDSPLIPLHYLRERNFVFPIGTQVFSNFAYMGGFILAPLLLEKAYGFSESKAGLLVIARPLTFSIVAPLAGYMAVKVGERFSAVTGSVAVVGSMIMFAMLGNGSPTLVIELALGLSGVGLGLASPSVAASVANAVRGADLGIASAAQQFMTQIGVVAGIQIMSTIQEGAARSHGMLGSFRHAYFVGAGVAVVAVICAMFVRSANRGELPTGGEDLAIAFHTP